MSNNVQRVRARERAQGHAALLNHVSGGTIPARMLELLDQADRDLAGSRFFLQVDDDTGRWTAFHEASETDATYLATDFWQPFTGTRGRRQSRKGWRSGSEVIWGDLHPADRESLQQSAAAGPRVTFCLATANPVAPQSAPPRTSLASTTAKMAAEGHAALFNQMISRGLKVPEALVDAADRDLEGSPFFLDFDGVSRRWDVLEEYDAGDCDDEDDDTFEMATGPATGWAPYIGKRGARKGQQGWKKGARVVWGAKPPTGRSKATAPTPKPPPARPTPAKKPPAAKAVKPTTQETLQKIGALKASGQHTPHAVLALLQHHTNDQLREILTALGGKGGRTKADLQQRIGATGQGPAKGPVKRVAKPDDSATYQDWLHGANADKDLTTAPTHKASANSIGGGRSDAFMAALNKETGYDAPAKVVSAREMDRLIAAGAQPLYRGVADEKAVRDFKHGPFHAGIGGGGNGTYTAPYHDEQSNGYNEALGYTSTTGPDGQPATNPKNVTRMVMKSGARVADAATTMQMRRDSDKQVRELWDQSYRQPRGSPERAALQRKANILSDLGRYAALHGYDAYFNGSMVVLNRGAVVVQDEPATPPAKSTPAPAARPAFNPADHVPALTAAVQKHGRGYNLAHLHKVRGELGHLTREQQDTLLHHAQKQGHLSLSALEGRQGTTPEERASAIRGSSGEQLGFVSLRNRQ
jgi:hypothetical protein